MKKCSRFLRAAVLCGITTVFGSGYTFAEEFIVKDGKPNAQIVIAEKNRPRMATLAALELQRGIEKISGARLQIVSKADAKIPVLIYVGVSPETKKLGVTDKGLKYGAFRIASGKNWLVLLGNDTDFVPTKLTTLKRKDKGTAKEWKKITAGKTDGAWTQPGIGKYHHYWHPRDFDKVLDEYYGEGSVKLWKSGGNTINGFWLDDTAGSVSAVTDFLASLGMQFYMPNDELGTVIPKLASIPLPELNKTLNPAFPCRAWHWYKYGKFPLEEVLWAKRLGINGGSGFYLGAHGLNMVHGEKKMQKAHPEYYALIGGKRAFNTNKGRGTPCFNSDGFFKETVNYCRFMFDKMNYQVVDLWPGDGLQQCQCDICKKKKQTPSEMVWGFINRVATELYKTHPDRLVNCGAYTSYKELPDTIEKFSPNVMIAVYNYGRAAFLDPEIWDHYTKNMEKFEAKLAPGHIRRGENNLKNGFRRKPIRFPIIFPRAMAKDLVYLKGKSVGEGAECTQYRFHWVAPGVNHLPLYVQARFLMNTDQDINQVLDEYYTLFYGPAAKEMKAAFTYAEDNIATKDKSKSAGRTDLANVPLEVKLRVRELLQKARTKAGDGIYGKRIAKIIAELQPRDEVIAEDQKKQRIMNERNEKAPLALAVEGADLKNAQQYSLKNLRTGKPAKHPTTFKLGWDKNTLLIDITCKEPDMKNLVSADPVYEGDYIAVVLETPLYSQYILHIGPTGKIAEGNPKVGRWYSLSEVKTEKGADFWRLQIRIPIVGAEEAEADPNHRVAGEKPTADKPWYFMIGRNRKRGSEAVLQGFSTIPKGPWLSPKYYGKLEVK